MALTTYSGKGGTLTISEMDANWGMFIRNDTSGAISGSLTVTGDITAFYTSDERLKEKVQIIEDAMAKIRQIDGVTFNWNDLAEEKDVNIREAGVLAQQVQKVLPEVVKERDNGYLSVQYEKMISILIQAVKELDNRVIQLEQNK